MVEEWPAFGMRTSFDPAIRRCMISDLPGGVATSSSPTRIRVGVLMAAIVPPRPWRSITPATARVMPVRSAETMRLRHISRSAARAGLSR
jgi:hypothetical protein